LDKGLDRRDFLRYSAEEIAAFSMVKAVENIITAG